MTPDKIKVLMVDDEAQFRETTKKILIKKGFDTRVAASGQEALDMLSPPPDVVILDIKMPGMDGHTALAAIKKQLPDLPVIMLTGHGGLDSAQTAQRQGACDYLAKPCDIDLLAAKIQDVCRPDRPAQPDAEKRVAEIMIPLEHYTTIAENSPVSEAIARLRQSFSARMSTSKLMETGHRSLLVFDAAGALCGVLTIRDLLDAIMPAYLSAPKPSTADSIQYSPMFWRGMFNREVNVVARKQVSQIMSPAPQSIDSQANLMEAAFIMSDGNCRRLVVRRAGTVVGVIREQDLFFEFERVARLKSDVAK